jgi:DNA-binding transcriptional LysR family regulator
MRRRRPLPALLWQAREVAQLVTGSLVVNNSDTMNQVALAGAGIARLGLFHVATDLATGRLVPLVEDCNPGDLELI